jgi:hypothetical protein
MNCKPGDLAVVVKDNRIENIGMLVNVVLGPSIDDRGTPCDWLCDCLIENFTVFPGVLRSSKEYYYACNDSQLRPIRDADKDDETLTWAGNPNEVIV